MKIAIDTSPLTTGHKVRGIGIYTERLINEFKKGEWPNINFEFFANPASPPPADVIHYPYFDLFFHTLSFKKKSHGRVVTIHDVIPLVFPKYFPVGIKGQINLFLQKMALKNIDAVICDSQTSKNDIVGKLSVPQNKIHIIYLAPQDSFRKIESPGVLSKVAKKYNLPVKFILYVGDINWNKNIPNLLEAVRIAKVNLVMVGAAAQDSNLKEARGIDNYIKKLGIENKVIKTGFVNEEDLVTIYNLASLTVLPSFYEGFGLPVLESMACGTPIICSKVASLAEISPDFAIFCDPNNPNDIVEKITKVLNLPAKDQSLLSRKCQEHARKFTWEKVAQQTVDVYKTISNK